MPVKIQLRRGTAAEWDYVNPILLVGEQGLETDSNKIKIGNGASAWNSLPYTSTYLSSSAIFSSSVNWGGVTNKPNLQIGLNLIGNTVGAASVTLNQITNGQISVTTNTLFANSASSMNWTGLTDIPSPIIGVNLIGNTNGSASVTLNQLTNGQISIITNTEFATSASNMNWLGLTNIPSPIIGINLIGNVTGAASATLFELSNGQLSITTNSQFANSASSINWSLITNRPSASPALNPQIGINLTGIISGAGSAVLNNLSNAQVTITTEQRISINEQTTASYTLQLSDVGKLITMNNNNGNLIIVPLESSVDFPIGSKIDISQIGPGTSSVTFQNGVSLNSNSNYRVLSNRYSGVTVVKINTDSWLLIGGLK